MTPTRQFWLQKRTLLGVKFGERGPQSVDEKPSIQALERSTGYVATQNGKIVQGFKSTYKRHGTLNLFAALEVATGAIHTQTTWQKRRVEFLAFMDQLLLDLPKDKEFHVIL